jgi:uncharacterized membrane protein YhaH (DUF805 family)
MKMPRSKYWWITIIGGLLQTVLFVMAIFTHYVLLLLLLPGAIYLWIVAFARLRDIGLVTWLAALLTVLRFALLWLISFWFVMEIIIWIVLGFIPTGAATGRVRFVEAPSA